MDSIFASQRRFLPFLVFALCLMLAGCAGLFGKQRLDTPPPVSPQTKREPIKMTLLQEAEAAFSRSDYSRVEVLGQRLLSDTNLSATEKSRAAHLYAEAALRANHPNVTLTTLDAWREASANIDASKEWQDIWCGALGQLSSREARTKASEVYVDNKRPMAVRGVAAAYFAVRQWEDNDLGETMPALEQIYTSMPDTGTKALVEGRLATQLQSASTTAVSLIAPTVTEANQGQFPYSIILIDQLRRQTLQMQTRAQATSALATLEGSIHLADPSLFKGPPSASQLVVSSYSPTGTQGGITGQPHSTPAQGRSLVVLALPSSGTYGAITSKIIAGAEIACAEMTQQGTPVSLTVIDTEQPDWVNRLEALPANAQLVGGPLRANDYSVLKQRGLLGKRAFFAFLPSLTGNDEGSAAWRFFTSPSDQVRALAEFSSSIGISKYGAFYPAEAYGQRMTKLFESEIRSKGGTLKQANYTPGQPESWMKSAGQLYSGGNFQAVFLPDTWKSMDTIVPNLFYHNAIKQVLLGTSLWEQGLTGTTTIANANNYALAVFPGGWNAVTPSSPAARLQSAMAASGKGAADVWSGIGYDFARFSAALPVAQGWSASTVNTALASFSLDWSIAPLHWDAQGKASQTMFLFTPRDGSGYAPVDREGFRHAFQQAQQ